MITVNTQVDEFDVPANVTDLTLGTGGVDGTISLREAVIAASNTAGATEIDLPVGTYNLGNVGTGELQVGNNIAQAQNIDDQGAGDAREHHHQSDAAVTPGSSTSTRTATGTSPAAVSNVTIQGATNVNQLFGGGAIFAGGPGDSLTLTNVVVQNNSTSNGTLSASAGMAVAISCSGGGNLTILNCTFSNNTAGGNANAGLGRRRDRLQQLDQPGHPDDHELDVRRTTGPPA